MKEGMDDDQYLRLFRPIMEKVGPALSLSLSLSLSHHFDWMSLLLFMRSAVSAPVSFFVSIG